MRSAESILREIDARLDLPARRRVLLLREIRADLDDLVAALVAEGCAPEEARARALALLVPDREDAEALAELHRSGYTRIARALPSRWARGVEFAGVAAMAALATLSPLLVLPGVNQIRWEASAALGGVALLILGHLFWNAFRIFFREDADAAGLIRAGVVQGGLIALALAVGALVTGLEAYGAAGHLARGAGLVDLMAPIAGGAAAAALALSIAMLGLFGGAALLQAHLSTRGVEEELRRLLAAPLDTGVDPI